MKSLVYAAIILVFSLFVAISCDAVDSPGGGDEIHDEETHDEGVYDGGAAKIVEDFIQFMKNVYETHDLDSCDASDPAFVEIYDSVESYYYIDNSADSYPDEGRNGVKKAISRVLCLSLPVISQATDVSCGLTLEPEDYKWIPEELEDEPITAVATVSLYDPNAGEYITRGVVKIGEKWYIRAVYHPGNYDIFFYPEREEIFF